MFFSKRQVQVALASLQQSKRSGVSPPALEAGVRRKLELERLAQTDEFGQTQITERGTQRLGWHRAAAPSGPASPYRRRGR